MVWRALSISLLLCVGSAIAQPLQASRWPPPADQGERDQPEHDQQQPAEAPLIERQASPPPVGAVSAKRSAPLWLRYLAGLSGLEIGGFSGQAKVSSQAIDAGGTAFTIASGQATSRGFKVRFFRPPTGSGWFFYPTLGFFWLDIDIADVAGDIPLGEVSGAKDIPALGSDPKTLAPIDLGAPNIYQLKLRSAYFGQRLGGSLVWGKRVRGYFSGELGLNLVEWRYIDARLGNFADSAHRPAFFGSFAGRVMFGMVIPSARLGVRCEVNTEYYREFAYPTPLPFEGRVTYNAALQSYERKEIKVEAVSAQTTNGFCGVSFVY
ncbi:MAG: hypothetical protein H6707_18245 [Deltaproteobacteria bacterium]|nr:hypothetical protein [Deltaproteobacteria bacterium]